METAKVVKRDDDDYSEAEYVDSQHEYLIQNKDKGISLEELCRMRSLMR